MANTLNKKKQSLSADYLLQQLSQFANQHNIKTWCLAYSGGVDSQVLLHLLHLTKLNVNAVYIDHGLQAQSADWAKHCEQQCKQRNISFQTIHVNARAAQGESPEAAARTARYSALKNGIQNDSCLLTAQHQDDQAETVLLQLLRGAGAAGLAGMPEITAFANGWHARPLLNISQKKILTYAQKNQLIWVEDPSNQHINYDRNYLRHTVIEKIKQRWPALNRTLSAFAKQQAENAQLLDVLAEEDLKPALLEKDSVDIIRLNKLDEARLRNALRFWIKTRQQPMPSRAVLMQIVQQIKNTSHDSDALVNWANCEVRRFRDKLYCIKKIEHDASQIFHWNGNEILNIHSIEKKLIFKKIKTDNENIHYVLNESILSEKIEVRFRQGGEKIKPTGRNGSHNLKSLFQEAAVPGWQRDRVPLLFVDEKLIAVVGYWIADDFAKQGDGVLAVLTS
ncbi:tRNA(Ile)-lysidine synthetase [hydrothermal vent metagenome]|uniref:tRNA(Ile)-lysidine synthetase n=1 Tax=hydrothermal vent metagenome TaxID=652676 RepID=A0A3B0XKR7_9ZZZZ